MVASAPQVEAETGIERQTAKGKLQRHRVLEAAAGQFVRHGHAAASMRGIADAAGIGTSSLYHYFQSKEDLLVAVHHEGLARIHQAVTGALQGIGDPWTRLQAACVAHLEALLEGGVIFQAVMRELPRVIDQEALDRIRLKRDAYERIFVRLIDDLVLPMGTDRHDLRLMLLGSLNWSFTWYRPGRSSPAELAASFLSFLKARLLVEETRQDAL